jgi:hypothetical protein
MVLVIGVFICIQRVVPLYLLPVPRIEHYICSDPSRAAARDAFTGIF